MMWYNKVMAIFSDYPAQETFVAEQPLDGAKFINSIKYRIVSEVPSNGEGEPGDVGPKVKLNINVNIINCFLILA